MIRAKPPIFPNRESRSATALTAMPRNKLIEEMAPQFKSARGLKMDEIIFRHLQNVGVLRKDMKRM
jgi:hypothetical protein